MAERVVPLNLGVEWSPNVPEAMLVTTDRGDTRLHVRHHFSDPDTRDVVLVWRGTAFAAMGEPNDEARIGGHRLDRSGLRDVRWIGEVLESALIAELAERNPFYQAGGLGPYATLHHWIVLLKETTAEVVADALEVQRAVRQRPSH